MTEQDETVPAPLRAEGATATEQRLLKAASRERPSRDALERMARVIGVAPPAIGPGTSGSSGTETVAPPAAAGWSGALPWVSGAIIAAAVGGALMMRSGDNPVAPVPVVQTPAQVTPPSAPPKAPSAPDPGSSVAASPETPTAATTAPPRARPSASASDLREQIALLDAGRAAMAAGKDERALEILQSYLGKYPAGSFRPEATALKIETLAKLGRNAESRALADRFVAEHGASPLANRVKSVSSSSRR